MKEHHKIRTLVTGSSGYVASYLIPRLTSYCSVMGVDILAGAYTDVTVDICNVGTDLKENNGPLSVVNLAAARFDFGAKARDYFDRNVTDHVGFLRQLESVQVDIFVHVSSVAAYDGRNIPYSDNLNCDDAYRATKYLQEVVIQKWCDEHDVPLTILYPSAIFSDNPRSDTNIGKLQSVSRFIPFIPKIEVIKSLTYLPFLSKFIIDLVAGEIPTGKYLTIENPSLTVSKIIQVISGRSIKLVYIPFFSFILKSIANFLYVLGFFGRVDLRLTPNRVVKLFSDTSYSHVDREDIDTETYVARNCEKLPEILAKFDKEKLNG